MLHVTEGKNKEAVKQIKTYLEKKNVDSSKITQTSIDLSVSFISGVQEHFPSAAINFDKFHVVQLLNRAMDEVRKKERKEYTALKGHKYTFLKNKKNLTEAKIAELSDLIILYPTLGEAYRLKELFSHLWEQSTREEATGFLENWCVQAFKSGIEPFNKFAKTVASHKTGIINAVENKITNGILESINCKIQLAKRRAKGFRNLENFKNMIYFLCGKLKFNYELYPLESS